MVDNEPYEPPRMLDIGEFGELTRGMAGPLMDMIYYYQ
ncbi:lasso RiPP family leader peptide-containing protein [Nonomuraea angiospora]